MLYVIVGVAADRYAIPARDIIEIVSATKVTPVPGASRIVAGLIQYRGRVVPLLDLGELCAGAACAGAGTTRILVVKAGSGPDSQELFGIRAERVSSTVRMNPDGFRASGVASAPYIKGVVLTGAGVIVQRIDLDCLLDARAVEIFGVMDRCEIPNPDVLLSSSGVAS